MARFSARAASWATAALRPDLVEKLIVLNLPHPRCLVRELAPSRPQAPMPAPFRKKGRIWPSPSMVVSLSMMSTFQLFAPNGARAERASRSRVWLGPLLR